MNQNKRIMLFIIPDKGAYNNFLREVTFGCIQEFDEVHVITSNVKIINKDIGTDPYASDKIIFHYIPFPRSSNPIQQWKASRKIRQLVKEIQPTLIHAHFSTGIFPTSLGKGKSWPITIGTFHGLGFPLESKLMRKIAFQFAEVFSSNRLDHVWVLTSDDHKKLSRFVPKRKVHYYDQSSGFGCDLEKFDPSRFIDNRNVLRQQFGIEDEVVFAFVGRFVDFKGFGLTVQAFRQLITRHKAKARLLLIGGKDPIHPTGLSEEEWNAMVQSPDITDLGFRHNVEDYLAISDAFVFPSEREGLPVCLMEASAMGIPIVTCDTRGCRDIVEHGQNGLIAQSRSVEDITQSMLEIYANKALRDQLKTNALSERSKFDRNLYVKNQIEIYKSLAG